VTAALAAAQQAETDARATAFWAHVGPAAPAHRLARAQATRAAWETAAAHLAQVKAEAAGSLFGAA